jgi:hypothetical protein
MDGVVELKFVGMGSCTLRYGIGGFGDLSSMGLIFLLLAV